MKPYYDDGKGIVIYLGDCREVLPCLCPESFDLVFTSPPYNLGNTTGGGFLAVKMGHYSETATFGHKRGGAGKWSKAAMPGGLAGGYGTHNDHMPHEDYVTWQKETLRSCWRLLSENGAIYYNHKPRVLNGVLVSPFEYLPPELQARQVVIWARAGGINFSPSFYVPTHEWIVVIAKQSWRLKSKGASGVGDVWYVPQETGGTSHPAQFPLALPARAIETTGAATVLDPFAGSGTTLVAAKVAGCKAIGIEIHEPYAEIAVNRLSQGVLPFAP